MRRRVASLAALLSLVALVSSGCAMIVTSSSLPPSSDTIGANGPPSISADGRYVAYAARSDTRFPGVEWGIFVKDNQTRATELISVSTTGEIADDFSDEASISADGRFVAFSSDADNLVPNDENSSTDIFVRDRVAKTTQRVSLTDDSEEADAASYTPTISDNGRYVAFLSDSEIITTSDENGMTDAFVRDRNLGTTVRADFSPTRAELVDGVTEAAISGNGRYVIFTTDEDNASDLNASDDIYRRDLQTGAIVRVSNGTDGGWSGTISSDGRWIAYVTTGQLVAADTNATPDVYLRDMSTSTRALVSAGPAGTTLPGVTSTDASVSANGRWVSFASNGAIAGADTNGTTFDVFVRDVTQNRTAVVGTDLWLNQPPAGTSTGRISADGRNIAYGSTAKLNNDDKNTVRDIYTRALVIPEITNVSPPTVVRGTTATLTVTGRNFLPGARARIGDTDASSVVVNSETSLTVKVNVPTTVGTGKVDLYVNNSGTGLGPNGGTVGKCALCITLQ
jgi:Tol biopolymer transport system component